MTIADPRHENRLDRDAAIAAMPRVIANSQRIAHQTASLAAAIHVQQITLQGVAEAIAKQGPARVITIPPDAYAVRVDIAQQPELDTIVGTLLKGDPSLTLDDALDTIFAIGLTTLKNTLQAMAIDTPTSPLTFYPAGSL